MNIVTITEKTYPLLQKFIEKEHPISFRYFKTKNIDVVNNHIITLIGEINQEPIAYAHVDHENGINWVGICVLQQEQGKKYGKQIFASLIKYIHENNIPNIQLSVDVDNYRAINLYLKNNFKITQICKKYYIMKLNNYKVIQLPVSLGEALDKLTILDIKMEKLKENRLKEVKKEYNVLFDNFKSFVEEHSFYYSILKKINLKIWEMQDEFRYNSNENNKTELCKKIIIDNDRRFRVKKKINDVTNSFLKEQKGYKQKKAFVLTHLGLGDNITAIGMVRYLSTCYDKVIVVCKKKNEKNVKSFYNDDKDIEIYSVLNDTKISVNFGFSIKKFNEITKDMDVYLCGNCHNKKNKIYSLPFSFYDDAKISTSTFWDYFYIPDSEFSNRLYKILEGNINYVFIHNTSSVGKVFSIEHIEKKLKISRNDILMINPCYNIYDYNHKFYDIANKFINHKLIDYTKTIINAEYVIVCDSSFMCVALNLEIKTDKCFYIARRNRSYAHLYNDKYIFDKNLRRQKFINLNTDKTTPITSVTPLNNDLNIDKTDPVAIHNMKKVVSFCLYGKKALYCLGAIENIKIIEKLYKGWEIYIYYNNIPDKILELLKGMNCKLIHCNSNGYKWEGMFWRFFPFDDDDIDIWISRDCDSRVTTREIELVDQWLNSDKCFHIIRDHPYHGIKILGGTFGVKNYKFRKISNLQPIQYYMELYYKKYHKNIEKWPDQTFLCGYVWNIVKNDQMAHISYNKLRFSKTDIFIKPVEDFVGKIISPSPETLKLYKDYLI